jgi:hypothetical protein
MISSELRHKTKKEDSEIYKITNIKMGSSCNGNGVNKNHQKITEQTSYKTRPAGRSRLMWTDEVEKDLNS